MAEPSVECTWAATYRGWWWGWTVATACTAQRRTAPSAPAAYHAPHTLLSSALIRVRRRVTPCTITGRQTTLLHGAKQACTTYITYRAWPAARAVHSRHDRLHGASSRTPALCRWLGRGPEVLYLSISIAFARFKVPAPIGAITKAIHAPDVSLCEWVAGRVGQMTDL